jgi:hypothetical protein
VYREVLDWLNGRTPVPRSEADPSGIVRPAPGKQLTIGQIAGFQYWKKPK